MIQFLNFFFESRLLALMIKEIRQILRNKQLLFILIYPPTLQLLIYGFALNPDVQNLRMGIVDYNNTFVSRELVSAFTGNQVFTVDSYSISPQTLGEQVRKGQVNLGLVIPEEFSRDIFQGKTSEFQVFIDGVDANTAGIANSYVRQITRNYSTRLLEEQKPILVESQVTFLYNPGLISSWFFVPGVIGIVLILTSSMVSSSAVSREKNLGTLEQLIMTPASPEEIILAKTIPLFTILMVDALLALGVGHLVFNIPIRGSLLLFLFFSGFYILIGISIGIIVGIISCNQRQVVLTLFFILLPLVQLSGAIAPIETMPTFFRYFTFLNPLRHYVTIVRGVLIKGIGIESLWLHATALIASAIALLALSINRFRRQL